MPEDVVLGLNFVPDETDGQVLAAKFAKGDSSARQFEEFCLNQELPVDSGHAKSAAHFLAFTEGQPLTWLHFPASQEGQGMAASVYEWATTAGHIIRRGQGERALTETEIRALWSE
ncbi:hypothetical protein CKO44_24955 [Rubrivivax gelatinosus]|nr:hypothetical protein [Rubrivivax gelatinosus]